MKNHIKNMDNKRLKAENRYYSMYGCLNSFKRGISAIEMIVSFILFLGFLVFIFAFMNPLSMPASRSLLTTLETSFNENATIEIETIPFAINEENVIGCFQIEKEFGNNFFITDKDRKNVNFKIEGNKITIENKGKFYYINKGISVPGAYTCLNPQTLQKGEKKLGNAYSLSVPRTETMYYSKYLAEINKSYYNNYSGLRQDLKFPESSDFAIVVFDESKNKMFEMTKPLPRTNILSKEFPVEILSENGVIIKGYMRLLVW